MTSFRVPLLTAFCMMAIYPSSLHAEDSHPEWFQCMQDSDCVVVGAGCTVNAVAKPFAEDADAYYKSLNARMDCAYPQTASSMRAVCLTQKSPCIRKKFFGLVEEVDPASTCVKQVCMAVSKDQP